MITLQTQTKHEHKPSPLQNIPNYQETGFFAMCQLLKATFGTPSQ